MKQAVVIGAGLSGLSCAYFLAKQGYEVDVYEAQARAGGMLGTLTTAHGRIETAANGFIATALVEEMAQDIGVHLQQTRRSARRRYICHEKPTQWPLGLRATLRLLPVLIKLYFFPQRFRPQPFETLRRWGERHLGVQVFQRLLAVGVQGIYAGDPNRLSATLLLRRFFDSALKQPQGQLRGTVAPPNGMGEWVEKLLLRVRQMGVRLHYGSVGPAVRPDTPVVIATSLPAARALLHKWDVPAAQELADLEMLPLVSVTFEFSREQAQARPRGFGVLFSQRLYPGILGVLFNDLIFENRTAQTSETWILGGFHGREILGLSDEALRKKILEHRQRVFSGTQAEKSLGSHVQRWPQALPHYTVDLEKAVAALELPPQLYLVGNYLGEIGLSHLIARTQRVAMEMIRNDKKGTIH
jgi:oxygen-dependent protoporphyrinogen oxidase